MILNKDQLIDSVRPKDERIFLRFLETKIEQVLKYPPLLPYNITTTFGTLEILGRSHVTFNNFEVHLESI